MLIIGILHLCLGAIVAIKLKRLRKAVALHAETTSPQISAPAHLRAAYAEALAGAAQPEGLDAPEAGRFMARLGVSFNLER